jgi:hypothetical protein
LGVSDDEVWLAGISTLSRSILKGMEGSHVNSKA